MATATIKHNGGVDRVEDFTLAQEVEGENFTNVEVWWSEPHKYEDEPDFKLYGDARIVSVSP